MSTRPQFGRPRVLLQKKVALAADTNTDTLYKEEFGSFSVQINVANAAGLNLSANLQGSLDQVNWFTLATKAIAGNGPTAWDYTSGVPFVRVNLDFTAGAADVEVIGHAIP